MQFEPHRRKRGLEKWKNSFIYQNKILELRLYKLNLRHSTTENVLIKIVQSFCHLMKIFTHPESVLKFPRLLCKYKRQLAVTLTEMNFDRSKAILQCKKNDKDDFEH